MPRTKHAERQARQQPIAEHAITTPTTAQVPVEMAQANLAMVLDRLVRDNTIPIERLERVVEMIDRQQMQAARRAYTMAMALAQRDMRVIATDASNPQTKSRYATLAALDRVIRPIYTKHGLFPSFDTRRSEQGEQWITVTCEVAHADGHSREYTIDMPADGKGAKGGDVMTKTHATGSAVTYGRRYLLLMIFNLAVGDDDGNAAGNEPLDEEQIETLRAAIVEHAIDLEKFCRFYRIARVELLPANKLDEALAHIEQAAKARAKQKQEQPA